MKKIFLTIAIVIMGIGCNAQTYSNNSVKSEKIKIDNIFSLNTSIDKVKNILGNPLDITTKYDEFLDDNIKILKYKGMTLFFYNGELIDFIITKNNHSLYVDDFCIKVGVSLKLLAKRFPKSYKNIKDGILCLDVIKMDYTILIKTNKKGIITKISLFIPS